jgi:hypothetical protein
MTDLQQAFYSNLNAGFTNLDGETLVKVIKPPIVHIDISGIKLDLDHVKGLLNVDKNQVPKYPNYINVSQMITLKSVYLKDLTILYYYYI